MIRSVQMKLGGTALSARLDYNDIVGQGIGKLRRSLSRIVEFPKSASPTFTVLESVENISVEFEVPGYGPNDLSVEATSHSVRLRSSEGLVRDDGRPPFDLSVPVSEPVAADQVEATLQNGVLTVELPKLAWVKGNARRVPVKVSPSGSGSDPELRDDGARESSPVAHRLDPDSRPSL